MTPERRKRVVPATLVFLAACGGAVISTPPGVVSDDGGADARAPDATSSETSNDGGLVFCNGGCLCSPIDACGPGGCYVSQSVQRDGSWSEPVCANGPAGCGTGWSFGAMSFCPGLLPPGWPSRPQLPAYPVTYIDGGPDGAFCCNLNYEYGLLFDAAADTGTDAGGPDAADASAEASHVNEVGTLPACGTPASLNDGGAGACTSGRAYLSCEYPSGVTCEGTTAHEDITMWCLSDDPTGCPGCSPLSGTATCEDMCAANEYGVSCGETPNPLPEGGSFVEYQQAPPNCVAVDHRGGRQQSCCPCE